MPIALLVSLCCKTVTRLRRMANDFERWFVATPDHDRLAKQIVMMLDGR